MKTWLTTIIVAVLLMAGTAKAVEAYICTDSWRYSWVEKSQGDADITTDHSVSEGSTYTSAIIEADYGEWGAAEVCAVDYYKYEWDGLEDPPDVIITVYSPSVSVEDRTSGSYEDPCNVSGHIESYASTDSWVAVNSYTVYSCGSDCYGYVWSYTAWAEAPLYNSLYSWTEGSGSPIADYSSEFAYFDAFRKGTGSSYLDYVWLPPNNYTLEIYICSYSDVYLFNTGGWDESPVGYAEGTTSHTVSRISIEPQ